MSEVRSNKIVNLDANGPVEFTNGIKVGTGASIQDLNGNELIDFVSTASAVNEIRITNAATGSLGPLIDVNGETDVDLRVGAAGTGTITFVNTLKTGAGTTTRSPIHLTSGTNLTTPVAGAIEYDGTTLFVTPNTSFGRASVPTTVYTAGAGTSIAAAGNETTAVEIFPAANDTINLPIGTYYINLFIKVTRCATSTTSATFRINLGGGGTAVGTFNGIAHGNIADGGAVSSFPFNGVALTVDNVTTAANTTAAGVYNVNLIGTLKITTAGSITPKYSLSADLAGGTGFTAVDSATTLIIQSLDTQSAAAAGPTGAGWT